MQQEFLNQLYAQLREYDSTRLLNKKAKLWALVERFAPRSYDVSTLFANIMTSDVLTDEFTRREIVTHSLTWGYPSQEVILGIKRFVGSSCVVECNAGRGLWSVLLQMEGVDVIPTDVSIPDYTFCLVRPVDAVTAVKTYLQAEGTVLTCWPTYRASYMTDALNAGLSLGFLKRVIYVGEGPDGCTGDKSLHRLLKRRFRLVDTLSNPRWIGVHDSVYLYEVVLASQ